MKKIISIAVAVLAAFTLAACGTQSTAAPAPTSATAQPTPYSYTPPPPNNYDSSGFEFSYPVTQGTSSRELNISSVIWYDPDLQFLTPGFVACEFMDHPRGQGGSTNPYVFYCNIGYASAPTEIRADGNGTALGDSYLVTDVVGSDWDWHPRSSSN